MTSGKTIALTRRTSVGKVMSLLLNMLSRLVITFLPRSKRLLISWLQSPSAVILESPQNKVWHCLHYFPICEYISTVQFSSVTQSCPALWDPMNCSIPGLPVHHQLPEFTQTHIHWVSDAIQPFHPLLSPSPPAFNLSQHQDLFQWVSSSHQVAKVLKFQLSISPSNEYSRLISFMIDWLDLLAAQGTLKSLL